MAVIQFRRGTADEWSASNPVLDVGEPGFETDTGHLKIGDGTQPWLALPFITSIDDLRELLVPRRIRQATADTVTRLLELDPHSDGVAPFQIVHKAFANGGGNPPNNGVWIGYNAERYLQDGSGEDGTLGWHMGLESGYHNPDDGSYGPEWYLNYVSPDGDGVPIATFRPMYVRLGAADTNTLADKWAHVLVDIGSDPEGVFGVSPGYAEGNAPSFYVTKALTRLNSKNVVAEGTWFTVRPSASDASANLVVDSKGNRIAVVALRVNGAPAGAFMAATANTFYISDKADQPVMVFNFGTNPTTRIVNARAKLKVDGVLELGSQVSVSSISGTGALGSEPELAAGSNSARGTIEFGTGAAPTAGDAAVIRMPATYGQVPNVVVSAANSASAELRPYAYATDTMTIRFGLGSPPPRSQARRTFRFNYHIVG
jgi:hypothetical protein